MSSLVGVEDGRKFKVQVWGSLQWYDFHTSSMNKLS